MKRLRTMWQLARLGWFLTSSKQHQGVISSILVSKKLLAEGNDQIAHAVAGEAYSSTLRATREYMNIGPDRQMARTKTFS